MQSNLALAFLFFNKQKPMIWKAYKINETNISNSGEWYEIVLTNVDFREVLTKENEEDFWMLVRDYSSKITLNWRIIKINWLIISRDNSSRAKWIKFLEKMFNFNKSEENKLDFTIIDDLSTSWKTKASILKPLTLKSKEDEYLWWTIEFSVVLKSDDARIFSSKKKVSYWEEFMYWWQSLPFSKESPLNSLMNKISCENLWNYKSPTIIEINVKNWKKINPPLVIKNLTHWKKMILDINWESEDKIIIDGFSNKITKNWLDISYSKRTWSVFLYVEWKDDFWLFDKEWWQDKDFDIKIYFNDVLV